MIGKVWIVARRRRGRKKHFALRWNEPVLDSRGQPVLDKEGKVQYRTVTESCKTSDRVTAQAMAEKKFGELNDLAVTDSKPTDVTIEELMALDEQWLRNRGRAEGTAYLSRLALRTFQDIVETSEWKPLKLSTITARDVENFLTARTEKIGARSLNREMVTLRATFNRAVRVFKVLKENPFANIELVKLEERAIRVLGIEEIRKLLKACGRDQELDLYIRIGLETGCRADEISHIESDNLDLKEGTGRITCSTDWRTKARRNRVIAFS
jgi:integrase